jgi:uncharacterized SAM-binding protein YcdF (DUF218 family)
MPRLKRTAAFLALVGVCAGVAGFVLFAEQVRQLAHAPLTTPKADGIVVLTGDQARISTGARLLMQGHARRLLISGVHPATRVPIELSRQIGGSEAWREAVIKCCIDLGRDAQNTSGNADEARQWQSTHGFRSLIVVTSSYHMPRSLTEFARAMPDTRLVPVPVASSRVLQFHSWWTHWPTARLLAGEYVKFLGSSARLHLARLATPSQTALAPRRPLVDPALSASVRSDR